MAATDLKTVTEKQQLINLILSKKFKGREKGINNLKNLADSDHETGASQCKDCEQPNCDQHHCSCGEGTCTGCNGECEIHTSHCRNVSGCEPGTSVCGTGR